jgi:hypothetical protein
MTDFFKSAPVEDMADFRLKYVARQGALGIARCKRNSTPETEDSNEEQLETPLDPLVDYSGWLRVM